MVTLLISCENGIWAIHHLHAAIFMNSKKEIMRLQDGPSDLFRDGWQPRTINHGFRFMRMKSFCETFCICS